VSTSKISILILNYNGLHRLKKVMPFILNQDYPNREIILFDNASTDGSLEYIKQFHEVKVIQSDEDIRTAKARNILYGAATGDYLYGSDNDIELTDKDTVSRLLEYYKTLDNPAFLSPFLRDVDSQNADFCGLYFNKLRRAWPLSKIQGQGHYQVPGFNCGSHIIKRTVFEDMGGFDETPIQTTNIDDYDMSARANLLGYKNYVTTDVLLVHLGVEARYSLKGVIRNEKFYFSGFSRTVIKNFKLINIIIWYPPIAGWLLSKNIYRCWKTKSIRPFFSFLSSGMRFLKNMPDHLKARKEIQSRRRVKNDVFLSIPTPKF
jgi:GT2 family glycosyltransferase